MNYEEKSLKNKTAIITGSNCGIGYETALDFAKRGNIHYILLKIIISNLIYIYF